MVYVLAALAGLLEPAVAVPDDDDDDDVDELQAAVATAMSTTPHAPTTFRVLLFI
jgi:hypothetical protein